MAVELTYNNEQLVPFGSNFILLNSIQCPYGLVLHENETGVITLRGVTSNPCAGPNSVVYYRVSAECNIAIPEGGTVQTIAIALTQNGEEIPATKAIITPAAAGDFWHVSIDKMVPVSIGCCSYIAIENVLPGIDSTEVGESILSRNLNVTINKVTR